MTMNKAALAKRLSSYWKLEAANIILVPGMMIWLSLTNGQEIGTLSIFCILPMCALLFIGAMYWRAKLHSFTGKPQALPEALAWIGPLQGASFVASCVACLLAATAWFEPQMSASLGDRIVASMAAALAMLEYVNYYHRQLQHFDHAADFKRLITGQGFRRSQMSVDLARWRRKGTNT